jgi:hypothetical protein
MLKVERVFGFLLALGLPSSIYDQQILMYSVMLVVLSLFVAKKSTWAVPNSRTTLTLAAWLGALILAGFWTGANFTENRWLLRGEFFLLAALVFQLRQFQASQPTSFSRKIAWTLLAMGWFAILACVTTLFGASHWFDAKDPSYFARVFGNANFEAQFHLLLLALAPVLLQPTRAYQKILLDAWTATTLSSVVFFSSRSAWMGLGIWVMIHFLFPQVWKRRELVCIIAASAVLSAIAFGGSYVFQETSVLKAKELTRYTTLFANKDGPPPNAPESASSRFLIYSAAVASIKDNPMGLGIGQFEFGSIPYLKQVGANISPTSILRSPHSEPLRLASEEGLLVAFVALALILAFGIGATKRIWNKKTLPTDVLFFVSIPEFLFQFPTELPSSMLIFAVAIGVSVSKEKSIEVSKLTRAFVIFIACLGFSIRWAATQTKPLPLGLSVEFCKVFPDQWRHCLAVANKERTHENTQAAHSIMNSVLKHQPFNYVALKEDGALAPTHLKEQLFCIRDQIFFEPAPNNEGNETRRCPTLTPKELRNQVEDYASQRRTFVP